MKQKIYASLASVDFGATSHSGENKFLTPGNFHFSPIQMNLPFRHLFAEY